MTWPQLAEAVIKEGYNIVGVVVRPDSCLLDLRSLSMMHKSFTGDSTLSIVYTYTYPVNVCA
jgi:hypothetical protein